MAQKQTLTGTIFLKVIDADTKLPVDYATIYVYPQGSQTIMKTGTSDAKGSFSIGKLPYGEYRISIGFMGYRAYSADHIMISRQKPVVALQGLLLRSSEKVLNMVNITAQTPAVQNKMDKLVYDPANDLSVQGGTAIDVLKKVPTLTVDIDGNIELLGSPGINFLINGKPSSIFGASLNDALASIPASQIKNIEVISNPGARYDAQGTGGVINIVLKDNKVSGVNGTVNLSAGTRLSNGSFNLNARKNSFGVNTFFSGNVQHSTTSLNDKRLTNSDQVDLLQQNGYSRVKRNGYQTGIGVDWNVTAKDNLRASVGYNRTSNNSVDAASQIQTSFGSDGLPLYVNSNRNASTDVNGNTLQWSLNYKKKFAKESQEFSFLYQSDVNTNHSGFSQMQDDINPVSPATGASSNSPGKVRETGFELNYTQPLSENFMIETGGKAFLRTISSVVDAQLYNAGAQSYVPDPLQSYNFKYNRNIFAYYLSASFKVFNALDVKAGARYEYTVNHTDFANTVIPNFGSLNPSVVISHQIDETQLVKASYSRRLERADYDELNPFVNRSDPYNISSGNPALKAEIGNNFEIGYSKSFQNGASVNVTAFYRHNGDDIKTFTDFYPTYPEGEITYTNVSYTSRINTGGENRYGTNLYASIPLSSNLTLRSNMLISHKAIIFNYKGLDQNTDGMEYRMNLNVAYQFPKDLSAEVFGNYNSPKVGIQGTNASFIYYTMALRKQFLNKKASIGLSATDPFNKYINQNATIIQAGNRQYSLRRVPYRSFGITFSYKFGNLKFDHKEEPAKDPEIPSL
ncbi:outer membrane beta-barrel family protein [Pedobacter hartonius]|uniref:Outer membrane receptor for ferrienterochelin and colicins n=1 Tax=Pedobacter hartonius TaxID=425514 RepID=A0A1H4E359_9SPHI|nr:outer membrane beta-barrel family protein [Pedobacter hartonius]SEA78832.1 Outer membrane receptor for ferrienterochelin and colicins [Pedobacter hartonius]